MRKTDLELLEEYSRHQTEEAFAELLRRHLDLVYSAALRQVRSPHLAEEVAQATFIKLAHQAHRLAPDTVLTAWLYQVARREAIDVVRREARRQSREQAATEVTAMIDTPPDWFQIEPLLDEAMDALDDGDRAAVLLRYFENKSLREVGEVFGTTDDAARKRVNRAVDRLREFFAERGVTVGASGLTVVLSAHAVHAAPGGLAITIATAASLTGTTLVTTTTTTAAAATATKAIAMTTLQKAIVGTVLAASITTAVVQVRESARMRQDMDELRHRQAEQTQLAQHERDEAAARQQALRAENDRLQQASAELLKLRAELTRLRAREQELANAQAARDRVAKSPAAAAPEPADGEVPKDAWTDVGFATPEAALRTRGWSVLNGNRDRFKQSVVITEGARKMFEDFIVQMAEAAKTPDAKKHLQEAINNDWGVEDGLLMPMMAENRKNGYTAYRILTEELLSPDERLVGVETTMASAPPKKEKLKFRRVGEEWKVVIDEAFVKQGQR